MATLNSSLQVRTGKGGDYAFASGKNYTEVFDQSQEIDNPDGFINLLTVSKSISVSTLSGAKLLVIHNTGRGAAEIQLKMMQWDDDGSNSDQANSIDLGPGSATVDRYVTFLLPSQEYMMFPSVRFVGYNEDASAANANSLDNAVPTGVMHLDSTADVDSATSNGIVGSNTSTTIYLEPYTSAADCTANLFRVGDLIRVQDEIMEVTAIGDKSDLANNTLTVIRGVHGSTAASDHEDDDAVSFAFFNKTGNFTAATGGYDTCQTDATGNFHSMNFFGYGRTTTNIADGLVPGSVAIKFYEPGYQELGLSGITPGTDTGLTAESTYYFKIAVDGGSADELSVTIDGSNTTFGGNTGLIAKIQNALNAKFHDSTANMFEKRVNVALVGGDVRFTSGQRLSTSAIALSAGTSGASTALEFFAAQNGRIPPAAKLEGAVAARLPEDLIYDKATNDASPNASKFLIDNGKTQLMGSLGGGSINYNTGEFKLHSCPPNAHFVISANYASAHSGGTELTTNGNNVISQIGARSVNQKSNTSIRLLAFN